MRVETIGLIIKNKRKKHGITQKYLAALSNTGTRFISELENGKETVELGKVLSVLNALDIGVNFTNE